VPSRVPHGRSCFGDGHLRRFPLSLRVSPFSMPSSVCHPRRGVPFAGRALFCRQALAPRCLCLRALAATLSVLQSLQSSLAALFSWLLVLPPALSFACLPLAGSCFREGCLRCPLAGIIHPYRTFLPDSSSAQPHLRGQPLSLLVPAGDKYLCSPTCGGCSSVGIRGVPGVWWGPLWFGILWAGLGGTVLMGDRVIFPDPHCLLYGRLCLCPLPGAFSRGGVSVRLILWLVSFPALPSLLSVPPYRCARVFRARCLFPDTFVGSCSGPSLFPPA